MPFIASVKLIYGQRARHPCCATSQMYAGLCCLLIGWWKGWAGWQAGLSSCIGMQLLLHPCVHAPMRPGVHSSMRPGIHVFMLPCA
eukprot:366522-Chlamydomonas_euryale.AAC.27